MADRPHHPYNDAHAHTHGDGATLIELLDLDGELFHSSLEAVIARVGELASTRPVRRIVDLGAGSGNGALALARHFADAEVIAVDQSADFLAHLRARAEAHGVGPQVHTVQANLDEPWPAWDPADLVWSSMAVHHLTQPDKALAQIGELLSPGGLLSLVELCEPVRFLPDDVGVGRPGLQARCEAVASGLLAEELPYLGANWTPLVEQAGFVDVASQTFVFEPAAGQTAAERRYALLSLQRTRDLLEDVLDADDRATLDALIDPDGPDCVTGRTDLVPRCARTLWTGVRP
jgi:SAM-dependent methyltransferase